MAGSSSANRRLHSSLRHFLVLARLGKIDSTSWHSLKDDILFEIASEDESVLQSAIRALENEKSCIVFSEWIQCVEDIKNLLRKHQRVKLLDSLESNVFGDNIHTLKRRHPDKPTPSNVHVSSQKKSKANSPPAYHRSSPASPMFPNLDSHTTGFYLLKTLQVTDDYPSLAIDDIVVAGATFAIVCGFTFDVAWMWDHAPAFQTYEKILIVHGEGPEEEERWRQFLRQEGVENRVRFVRPKTPPYGTVHSKLMVLCFPTTCRVCIHTANMIQAEWDYKTQGAYMRDFPIRNKDGKNTVQHTSGNKDSFKTELVRYFEHCLTGEARMEFLNALNMYDFSSAGVEVVASVPGTHRGTAKDFFGHARLRRLLRKEHFPSRAEPSTAVCQFSSLGSIQEKWIDQEFHDTLFASIDSEESTTSATRAANQIKLVFPTVEQVFQSNEGVQAGLTLPVRSKNLQRDHITRKLCRWEGIPIGRDKAMPHIKTYLRYPNSRPSSPYWLLLGSFNLSVAAWGRMQGGSRKTTWDRLNVLSYEIGVLFLPRLTRAPSHTLQATVKYIIPTREKEASQAGTASKSSGVVVSDKSSSTRNSYDDRVTGFLTGLPIPYRIPPPPYRTDDVAWTLDFYT